MRTSFEHRLGLAHRVAPFVIPMTPTVALKHQATKKEERYASKRPQPSHTAFV